MAKKIAYQKDKQGHGALTLAIIVMLLLVVILAYRGYELNNTKQANQKRIEELQSQIADEEERTEQIEEYARYTQTKKYVEEVAKDKLGLVYEGEIVFKDEK